MAALRDTIKGLLGSTVVSRNRDDLRPGLQMATCGGHCVFFEADQSRVLVVRVRHDRMDYQRHLDADAAPDRTGESAQAARLSPSQAAWCDEILFAGAGVLPSTPPPRCSPPSKSGTGPTPLN